MRWDKLFSLEFSGFVFVNYEIWTNTSIILNQQADLETHYSEMFNTVLNHLTYNRTSWQSSRFLFSRSQLSMGT